MSAVKYEYCCLCDQPTGRAGQGEDSLYAEDGTGPYCEACYDSVSTTSATAAASPAQPAQQDSRAEFEAVIAASNDFTDWTKGPDGEYQQPLVRLAWKYWQAARSAPRPVLTDAQIQEIWTNNGGGLAANRFFQFARAIERAVRDGGGKL